MKMADKRKPSFPPSLNKIPGMGLAEFDEKISREQLEQIKRNLPLQNEAKDKVEDCASYLYDTFLLAKAAVREKKKDGLASPAGVARQLKYIQKGSITLLDRLKDADRNTFEAWADTSDLERHEATQEWLQLERLLQNAAERAEQAARAAEIEFLSDGAKRGRRRDVVADVVTVIAAKAYETLTGKYAQRSADRDSGKPYGSFHDFLTQVFQALGISSSPDACNMRLQDELRHLRK
jgi:hypothetical protein